MVGFGPFYLSPIFFVPIIVLILLVLFNVISKSPRKKRVRPSILVASVCLLMIIPQTVYEIHDDADLRSRSVDITIKYHNDTEKKSIEVAEKFNYDQVFQNITSLKNWPWYINENTLNDQKAHAVYYRDHPFSDSVFFYYLVETKTVHGPVLLTIISSGFSFNPTSAQMQYREKNFIYAMLSNGSYVVDYPPKMYNTFVNITLDDSILVDMQSNFFQGYSGEHRHQIVVLDMNLTIQMMFLFEKGMSYA